MSEFFLSSPLDFTLQMSVVTCILEYNKSLLFLQRSEDCIQPFTWCIPGGKLELNEGPLDGLVREIQEELSLTINTKNIQEKMKIYVRHSLMDYVLYVYYWPLITLPTIHLQPREHRDFTWQPIDQIDSLPLLEGQREVLLMALPSFSQKNLQHNFLPEIS